MKKGSWLWVVFLIVSCNYGEAGLGDAAISDEVTVEGSFIPYASDSELQISGDDKDILDYQLVRALLKIDFELGIDEMYDWEGSEISEKPVIIYDHECRPEYYEFIVISGNKAVGTITAYATRKSSEVVSHIIPWVRDYTSCQTKFNHCSLFSEGYPTRMVCGLLNKAGEEPGIAVDIDTGETIELSPDVDEESFLEEMHGYSEDELLAMGYENWEEEYNEYKENLEEDEDDAAEFWKAVETYQDNFLSLTDDEIEEAYNETKYSDSNVVTTYSTYILPKYGSQEMQSTFWNGWCFPSAMCWFYRGMYDSYNNVYLPLDGDSSFDQRPYRYANISYMSGSSFYSFLSENDSDKDGTIDQCDNGWIKAQSQNADSGLYYHITKKTNFYYWGDGNVSSLLYADSVVRDITGNRYRTVSTLLHSSVHKNIRDRKLPAFIREEGHIMNGFGSRYQIKHWTRKYKFLWWSWSENKSKIIRKYWLIQDNSYKTQYHGFKPFWSNDENYRWKWHIRVVSN